MKLRQARKLVKSMRLLMPTTSRQRKALRVVDRRMTFIRLTPTEGSKLDNKIGRQYLRAVAHSPGMRQVVREARESMINAMIFGAAVPDREMRQMFVDHPDLWRK